MAHNLFTAISDYSENTTDSKDDDLIIFGYSCKLFRNDAKYSETNNGSLLVPWFNDKSLMIDRFDGRGVLPDLENYDGEVNKISVEPLSTHDRCLEEACNEERYRDLYMDANEADILEEEEQKRSVELVREDYAAVGFNYDNETNAKKETPKEEAKVKSAEADDSTPYEPPSSIIIPHGYVLPKTEKQGLIIERTAQFIAQQGTQMEIVVKTKQAKNPHFTFLHYDSPLNPFYQLVVNLIKTGRYVPGKKEPKKETAPKETYQHKSIHEDHYELKLPKVDISNTSYARLISQFKKDKERRMNKANSGTSTPVLSTNQESNSPRTVSPAPSTASSVTDTNGTSEIQTNKSDTNESQPNCNEASSNAASSELSSNQEKLYNDYYHHYYNYYYKYYESMQSHYNCSQQEIINMASNLAASAAASAVQSLAASQYNSSSQSTSDVKVPPDNLRAIIDRLADYVARNGPEFEEIVRQKKQDDRFVFLDPNNEYHPYYLMKREEAAKIHDSDSAPSKLHVSKSDSALKDSVFGPANQSDNSSKDSRSSICFALKTKPSGESPSSVPSETPEERINTGSNKILFTLDDDDDDDDDETDEDVPDNTVNLQTNENEIITNNLHHERESSIDIGNTLDMLEKENQARTSQETLTVRKPEDRLRDQLASAARECLSEARREADIQAERKRKAAAFMAKLREEKRLREETERIEKEREMEVAKSKEILSIREKTPPLAYSSSNHTRSSRSRSPISKSSSRYSSQR